ncbi:MAG: hypothetical protein U0350_33500 [Caldilineaceae bacterium]
MLWKIEGYLVIPHELLHVAAHKLIGKRCAYHLGENFVTHLEPHTWGESVFCLLFPLLISLPVAFLPLLIWFLTYLEARYPVRDYIYVAPLWHQALFVAWFLLFNYVASCSFFDVVKVVQLLLKKLSHQPPDYTDTDFLF